MKLLSSLRRLCILLCMLFVTQAWVQAQMFKEKTNTGLPNMGFCAVAVGDINNDGKLDIVMSGYVTGAGSLDTTRVFFGNGNGTFTESAYNNATVAPLKKMEQASVALGDYDKDGYLDLLLTGYDRGAVSTKRSRTMLYRNSGPPNFQFLENTATSFMGVNQSDSKFFDFNNDGWLDIVVSGVNTNVTSTPGSGVTKSSAMYKNNGDGTANHSATFAALAAPVIASSQYSCIVPADYDNDGDMDLIAVGYPALGQYVRNNGDGTFYNLSRNTAMPNGNNQYISFCMVDYDNDGVLNPVFYGGSATTGFNISTINTSTFAVTAPSAKTFNTALTVSNGNSAPKSMAWADFDNDSLQDVFLTSLTVPGTALFKQTAHGVFTQVASSNFSPALPAFIHHGNVVWGDFNNDGKLDLFIVGCTNTTTTDWYTGVTKIYLSNVTLAKPQTKALPPNGLTVFVPSLGTAKLSWSKTTDGETPAAGLTYNIRVGSLPGGNDIFNSELDPNGMMSVPGLGGIRATLTDTTVHYTIKSLAPGMYYCSVQAIDYGFLPGVWAPDVAFEIKDFTDLPTTQATMKSNPVTFPYVKVSNGRDSCTINWTNGDGNKVAVFMKIGSDVNDYAVPVKDVDYTGNASFKLGSQIGSSGWYCVCNKAVTPNSADTVMVSGLQTQNSPGALTGNAYQCMVFSYNGRYDKTVINYLTDHSTGNPCVIDLNKVNINALNVNTNANGTNVRITPGQNTNGVYPCVVFMKQGSDATEDVPLVNGTVYTANSVFGTSTGTQPGSGWYCVYNGNSPYASGSVFNPFNYTTATALTFSSFSGLILNTPYQVRACTYAGATALTPQYSTRAGIVFTTAVPKPTVQTNTITTGTITSTAAYLYWTNGNGQNRVIFATSGVTAAPVLVDNTDYAVGATIGEWKCIYNGNTIPVKATPWTGFTGLNPGTTYQVAAYEYNGVLGQGMERYFSDAAISNPITLTTLPYAPVISAPTNIDSTSFTANWAANAFYTASGYQLDVATDNAFINLLPAYTNKDLGNVVFFNITGLSSKTTYFYRIRSYTAVSPNVDQNSLTASVVTTPAPVATAATNVSYNSFTANWNVFTSASGYYLDISTDPNFATFLTGYNALNVGNVTSFTGDTLLMSPTVTYYYRVKAYFWNSSKVITGSSAYGNTIGVATTMIPVPGITIAQEGTSAGTASFIANWAATWRATGYYLDVATDPNFTNFVGIYNHLDVGNVVTYAVATNLGSPYYYYRLTSYNMAGASAGPSNVITVTQTAPVAPVLSAATNILQNGFDANWSIVPGAYSYQIDVSNSASFAVIIQTVVVPYAATGTVIGLNANTNYWYKVTSINASGSTASSVATVSTVPVPPVTALPATNVTPTYFTANWTLEPTATSYRLDISTDALFSSYTTINTGSSYNFLVINVTPATTQYYYRARAVNGYGSSVYSNTTHVLQYQTVTFNALPTMTYGATVLSLSATASSGLPVTYTSSDNTVVSVVGSNLDIHTAGFANITANQVGDVNYSPASLVQPLSITKRPLTVAAVRDTIVYGNTPNFKVTYSNFATGEDSTVLKGSPVITTVPLSALEEGGKALIVISQGTLRSINYNFNFVSDTLLVKSATGVKTIAHNDIQAYPNPTTGLVTIQIASLSAGASVAIYSDMGILVRKVSLTSTSTSIDLSDLPSGAYILKISGNNQTVVKHILKY
jgi:hypothetical protein